MYSVPSTVYLVQRSYSQALEQINSLIDSRLTIPSTTAIATFAVQTAGYNSQSYQIQNATVDNAPLTSSREASWQTVFGALAAITVNTCLQDSGRVCGTKKEFARLIRTSPIFCLADFLVISFQLLYYSFTDGPKHAVQIVASSREHHSLQLARGTATPILHIVRGVLLVVAVLQSIKLYAIKGIPWTQFFGACFLVHYVITAILGAFGKPPRELDDGIKPLSTRDNALPNIDTTHLLQAAAIILQLALWSIISKPLLPEQLLLWSGTYTVLLHLAGMSLIFIPFYLLALGPILILEIGPCVIDAEICMVPVTIIMILLRRKIHRVCLMHYIALLFGLRMRATSILVGALLLVASIYARVYVWPWYFTVFFLVEHHGLDPLFDFLTIAVEAYDPYGVMLVLTILAALVSWPVARVFLFGILAEKLRLRNSELASNMGMVCLFVFCANIVYALLYFSQAYTSQNTYKPEWTENLGKLLM